MQLSFFQVDVTTDMTTEKAKRLAVYYAKKEMKYVKTHTFDVGLCVSTAALSGFVLSIIQNL